MKNTTYAESCQQDFEDFPFQLFCSSFVAVFLAFLALCKPIRYFLPKWFYLVYHLACFVFVEVFLQIAAHLFSCYADLIDLHVAKMIGYICIMFFVALFPALEMSNFAAVRYHHGVENARLDHSSFFVLVPVTVLSIASFGYFPPSYERDLASLAFTVNALLPLFLSLTFQLGNKFLPYEK